LKEQADEGSTANHNKKNTAPERGADTMAIERKRQGIQTIEL